MQIKNQIEQLIQNLNSLKPILSSDPQANQIEFKKVLQNTLDQVSFESESAAKNLPTILNQSKEGIPTWVHSDYGYDKNNPRKPNLREYMEVISGKSIDELYKEPNESWQKIRTMASEMLYGVLGSNKDTRDWATIMTSDNIEQAVKIETGKMYEPKIDVVSNFNQNGTILNQVAVIKDKNENILKILPNNTALAKETLQNFGATQASVPNTLEKKIVAEKFDNNLLVFLKNFDDTTEKIERVALQTATENISKKLSDEIPDDELEKL